MDVKIFLRILIGAVIVAAGVCTVGCSSDSQQAPEAASSGSPQSQTGISADAAATAECLRDRGWEIVISDDGEGWHAAGATDAQADAYFADANECAQLYATIEPLEAISKERWESGYARQIEFSQCLRDLGYPIPAIPSFQAWKESFFVGDNAESQWTPWDFVPVETMSDAEFRSLEAACPQPDGP